MQKLLILKAREKALRSTNNHPKCVALAADIPQVFKIATASVARPTTFLPFCHLNFSTNETLTIFHLQHGSLEPLTRNQLPPLFLVSLAGLMTLT